MNAVLEDLAKQAEQIIKNITPEDKADFGDHIFLVFPKINKYIHAKNLEELIKLREEFIKNYSPSELGSSFTFFGATTLT